MTAWMPASPLNKKRTILIISQDSKMVAAWRILFKQRDCYVIHEVSPHNALQTARLTSPALTILDLNLPQSECVSLCKQIRPMTSGAIFLLVPNFNEKEAVEYYSAGIDERLSSTISPAALLAKSMLWLRIVPREKNTQIYV